MQISGRCGHYLLQPPYPGLTCVAAWPRIRHRGRFWPSADSMPILVEVGAFVRGMPANGRVESALS